MKLDYFVSEHLELPGLARHQELQANFREKTKLIIMTFSNLQLSSQQALNFISHVGTCFTSFSKEIQGLTSDRGDSPLYEDIEGTSPLVSLIVHYYKSFQVFFEKVLEDYDDFQQRAGANFSRALKRFEGLRCELQMNSDDPVKVYEDFFPKVMKAKTAFESKIKEAQKFIAERKEEASRACL